jgi:hypothetical protein
MSSVSTNVSTNVVDKRQRPVLATSVVDGSVIKFLSCGAAATHCRPDIKEASAKTKIYGGLKDTTKTVYGYTWKYADTVDSPDTVWMPVQSEDAEGWQVSDDGRVKSPAGRVQAGCVHRDGHINVEIAGKTRVQHALVAEAFLCPMDNSIIVHIDGDKSNNSVSNLKRISRSELMLGKMAQSSSSKIVGVDQYSADMVFIKTHKSIADANRSIGKSANATGIKMCVSGKIAKSAHFIWKRHEPAMTTP